jgi:hypothetical protein
MLSIPRTLEKKNISLREFISDVVISRGNRKFPLKNLQAQIWGVTIKHILKYLRKTRDYMLVYHCEDLTTGYTYSDF